MILLYMLIKVTWLYCFPLNYHIPHLIGLTFPAVGENSPVSLPSCLFSKSRWTCPRICFNIFTWNFSGTSRWICSKNNSTSCPTSLYFLPCFLFLWVAPLPSNIQTQNARYQPAPAPTQTGQVPSSGGCFQFCHFILWASLPFQDCQMPSSLWFPLVSHPSDSYH